MRGAAQTKFKSSVAWGLHPLARSQTGTSRRSGRQARPKGPFPVDRPRRRGLQSSPKNDGEKAMAEDADIIVVGGGLAGLVAATELADAGKRVIVVDQEGEQSLGGQAFWSFGGLFLVDSPEQRRLGIKDSRELALQDWWGAAGFDRPEDHWPR